MKNNIKYGFKSKCQTLSQADVCPAGDIANLLTAAVKSSMSTSSKFWKKIYIKLLQTYCKATMIIKYGTYSFSTNISQMGDLG